jgi:hypothetical protein
MVDGYQRFEAEYHLYLQDRNKDGGRVPLQNIAPHQITVMGPIRFSLSTSIFQGPEGLNNALKTVLPGVLRGCDRRT